MYEHFFILKFLDSDVL